MGSLLLKYPWIGWVVGVWVAWIGFSSLAAAMPSEGTELIGTKAPEWHVEGWIHSKPLSLGELRGQVVLVRWWTGPECSYCAASAPYLNAWDKKYRSLGLVVIGFYHHKSSAPLSHQQVLQLVDQFGFQFPVAIDPQWQTLKRWWLDAKPRSWTSVTFLIDREGTIRDIHRGGSYTPADAQALDSMIQTLLAVSTEPSAPRTKPLSSPRKSQRS